MHCNNFKDNRKHCFDIFGKVVNYIDEERCKSEIRYKDCIFYKMMNQADDKQCRHMIACKHIASITLSQVPYHEMKKQCETYCLNEENRSNCALFKLFDELKIVPIGLLPDGTMIKVKNKKIITEKQIFG